MKNMFRIVVLAISLLLAVPATATTKVFLCGGQASFSGKKLGTIFNSDINNIIWRMGLAKEPMTPEVYRQYLDRLLDGKPGLLAQNVGLPEGVIYPTKVDTNFTKHWDEVCRLTRPNEDQFQCSIQTVVLKKLYEAGTDPLKLTIEACRKRGVLVVADYRMNAEDCYANSWLLSYPTISYYTRP